MPSRRALLAATGTAAASAVAGCSTLRTPDGSSAEVRSDRDLLPADGEPVADATADRTSCPRGDVELRAVGFELPEGALQVLTRIDVYPGTGECESDWTHDGIHITHDWRDLGLATRTAVTDTASNVVYTETAGDVRFENTSDTETGEWQVRRSDGGGDIEEYRFRSTYTFDDAGETNRAPVDEGDELAEVTVEVPLSTAGPLSGGSEVVTLEETLVYGRTAS